MSTAYPPINHPMTDPRTGRLTPPWVMYFSQLQQTIGPGTAPVDAQYIVGATNPVLTAERLATNSASNTWNLTTPGQAKVERAALTGDVTASANSNATTIANNAVTDAKLRQSAGLSVVGRSANSAGNVADMVAASDFQVLRRSGTAVGFGAVNLASANAVTGVIPIANGGSVLVPFTFPLTNAQILTLPTTPIDVLAALGANARAKLIAATLLLRNSAGAYTNVDPTTASLVLQNPGGAFLSALLLNDGGGGVTQLTDFFTTFTDTVVDLPVPYMDAFTGWVLPSLGTRASFDNQPVQLAMDNNGAGNLTGGNVANTLLVSGYYAREAM